MVLYKSVLYNIQLRNLAKYNYPNCIYNVLFNFSKVLIFKYRALTAKVLKWCIAYVDLCVLLFRHCCNYTAFICTACIIFFALYILGLVREFNESFTAIDETQQGFSVLLDKIQSPLDWVAFLIRNAKLLRHFLLC